MQTTTVVGYERADGSHGRIFVGACETTQAYRGAVALAVDEARRDGGRLITVQVTEEPGGRVLGACYSGADAP